MNVLLTGIAGFIGSQLSEQLLESDHKVLGLDCFTPYYSEKQKRENLKKSLTFKNCTFLEGNILDIDFQQILRDIDVIVHLAAQPGVRPSWSEFETYVRHNVLATKKILDAAANTKVKLVFASSSSVYGEAEAYPTKEDTVTRPVSPYGITKDTCEKLCHVYHKTYSLPVAMLRFFTVYGPRQRPDMAFHKFVENMLAGKKIEVYGDGNQIRDFTYVADTVRGIISTLELDFEEEILNLGGGRSTRLNDVIVKLQKIIGSNVEIVYSGAQKGDATKTLADITKAKKLLGYSPETKLDDGLASQVEWHKNRLRE